MRATDADLERRDACCGGRSVPCGVTRITARILPTCLLEAEHLGPNQHPAPSAGSVLPAGLVLEP